MRLVRLIEIARPRLYKPFKILLKAISKPLIRPEFLLLASLHTTFLHFEYLILAVRSNCPSSFWPIGLPLTPHIHLRRFCVYKLLRLSPSDMQNWKWHTVSTVRQKNSGMNLDISQECQKLIPPFVHLSTV